MSEKNLLEIAKVINQLDNRSDFIYRLVTSIPKFERNYDWNVGSVIRHFESSLIIEILKSVADWDRFYNSIGLTWVLGEYNNHHPLIKQFLYGALKKTDNSDVWWRSAYSLTDR